jgi:hypothetical protein
MLRMFRNQPDLSHVKGLDVAESWTKDPVKLKSTLLLEACNGLFSTVDDVQIKMQDTRCAM